MKLLNNYMVFENLQFAKKVLKDLNIPEDNPQFLKLKELLKNNIGYMGKFTEWMFKDREPVGLPLGPRKGNGETGWTIGFFGQRSAGPPD